MEERRSRIWGLRRNVIGIVSLEYLKRIIKGRGSVKPNEAHYRSGNPKYSQGSSKLH